MLQLSIRLGVILSEIERLPVPTIMEYIAVLNEDAKPKNDPAPQDVESSLKQFFGKPKDGKPWQSGN